MTARPQFVARLRDLLPHYDGFLIDQWGVLHGGLSLYPGAAEAMRELTQRGKKTIILTNSSKTNVVNIARLEKFGLPETSYSYLVSSAQVLLNNLIGRAGEPWEHLGANVFVVASGTDAELLANSNLVRVSDVDDADFVLLLSIDGSADVTGHAPWMQKAVARKLPLFGPSADAQSVAPGAVNVGLGALCDHYRHLGGKVMIVGKPEPIVYEECERLLPGLEASRIAAIGDQIASDVLGAQRRGYHSILVGTGAAESAFAGAVEPSDWENAAISWARTPQEIPQWVLPAFRW